MNNSKVVQVPVTLNTKDYYSLGQANTRLKIWRPSGRLITTLFEHKNAVNTLAVTDDS